MSQQQLDEHMTPALFRFHALRLAQHSARWREHQAASDRDVLVVRFEDLKRDCDNQLKRLLHWLGVSVDATVLRNAMSQLEARHSRQQQEHLETQRQLSRLEQAAAK